MSGLLKRNGYVYAKIVPNAIQHRLCLFLREKVRPHCFDYTDIFRAYDVFKDRLALLELHVKETEHAVAPPRRLSYREFAINILKLRVQILRVRH